MIVTSIISGCSALSAIKDIAGISGNRGINTEVNSRIASDDKNQNSNTVGTSSSIRGSNIDGYSGRDTTKNTAEKQTINNNSIGYKELLIIILGIILISLGIISITIWQGKSFIISLVKNTKWVRK